MKPKAREMRLGLTLIEIMVALVVIVVGVLGAMMYRYHSALDARKADIQVGAGRVGLLILEGWKGAAGADDYDPSANIGIENDLENVLGIEIDQSGVGYKAHLAGGTGAYYYVDCSHQDLPSPNFVKTNPDDKTEVIRELRVRVTWSRSAGEDIPSDFTGQVVILKDHLVKLVDDD